MDISERIQHNNWKSTWASEAYLLVRSFNSAMGVECLNPITCFWGRKNGATWYGSIWGLLWRNPILFLLASQDALEVTLVTHPLSHSLTGHTEMGCAPPKNLSKGKIDLGFFKATPNRSRTGYTIFSLFKHFGETPCPCLFKLDSYQSQWILMSLNESQRVSMNLNESERVSMNLNESERVSMSLNESQWVSMSLNESQWVSMDLKECQWVSMRFNEVQWELPHQDATHAAFQLQRRAHPASTLHQQLLLALKFAQHLPNICTVLANIYQILPKFGQSFQVFTQYWCLLFSWYAEHLCKNITPSCKGCFAICTIYESRGRVVNCPTTRWFLLLLIGYLCQSSIFHNPDNREI